MLQNAYFLAKIGADTAENEQYFAEILPTDALCVSAVRSGRGGGPLGHRAALRGDLRVCRGLPRAQDSAEISPIAGEVPSRVPVESAVGRGGRGCTGRRGVLSSCCLLRRRSLGSPSSE